MSSIGVSVSGWNSVINAQSTLKFSLIPSTFLPSNFTILIIYPLSLTFNVNPPATQVRTTDNQYNYLSISNVFNVNNLTTFNATIINPASVIALPMLIYYLYNTTYFISRANVNTFVLTGSNLNLTATLSTNIVMSNSNLNLVGNFNDPISSGSIIITSIIGSFVCSGSITINSNIFPTNICNSTYISISISNFNGSASISINYLNPMSTQINTILLTAITSQGNTISSGSVNISFSAGIFYLNVTNNNLVLN